MPKSTKRLSGGQERKSRDRPIHPYSRKAVRIDKQLLHTKRVESTKSATALKLDLVAEKFKWFQVDRSIKT